MSFSKRQLNRIVGNVPIGTVIDYAGSTAPAGYLFCDGAAVSRATYAELFATIGTSFGVGDGSTTFNLPDLRGKVAIGKHSSGTFTTLGSTGGVENVTLTAAQSGVPSHGHAHTIGVAAASTGVSTVSHGHTYQLTGYPSAIAEPFPVINRTTGGSNFRAPANINNYNDSTDAVGNLISDPTHAHSVTGSVTNHAGAAASSSHSNVQPYQVVHKAIRYASGSTASSPVRNEVPSGTIDGANAVFTTANTPSTNTQEVYLNGIRQRPGVGFDYTISGATITFSTAPPISSTILVDYFVGG